MMRRQAHFCLRTIILMVAMYLSAKAITWCLGEWELWFSGVWMAGLFVVVLLMGVVERHSRRHGRQRPNDAPAFARIFYSP
jgi:hypothetical protein